MIRFACPSCKFVSTQPDSAAGRAFTCPECRQRLLVPASPESPPANPMASAPQLPDALPSSFTTEPRRAPATPPPPVPPPLRRQYDDDEDDFEDDGLPSIQRRRRGYYSREEAVKAASAGLACALISLALLIGMVVLWIVAIQSQRMRFGGGPSGAIVVVILLIAVVSLVVAIMSIVYSSRGLDASNTYNRGQATAGLICGIVSLVIGCIAGLFFTCVGMVVLSIGG